MDVTEHWLQHRSWPQEGLTRVPYWVFHDPEIYRQEEEKIWRGPTWSFLALDAEIPKPFDYKNTFVGETPVVVTRAEDGSVHAWVNRCAHRGALVCRDLHGNTQTHTCVYHQWSFDLKGDLVGVPFRRGISGKGGYPKDFDLKDHGLTKLRTASFGGIVFGTFSAETPPLEDFLGKVMCANIQRVMHKPIRILGHSRQYIFSNWKLYSENTRDSYHAMLLHLFYPTFGIAMPKQKSMVTMDERYRFHNLFTIFKPSGSEDTSAYGHDVKRTSQGFANLEDPSLLKYYDEFNDGIIITIQSLFPSMVLQQIVNGLAVRHIQPKGPGEFELKWTYFAYEDDSEEMVYHRLKQVNMLGPAGLIAMEDGEAAQLVQQGTKRDSMACSAVEMGGDAITDLDQSGADENSIRGFWNGYRKLMGL